MGNYAASAYSIEGLAPALAWAAYQSNAKQPNQQGLTGATQDHLATWAIAMMHNWVRT